MSGSAVVALERRVPRIILKLPRPPPPLEQGGRLARRRGWPGGRARDGRADMVCEAPPRRLDENTWRPEGHQERRS